MRNESLDILLFADQVWDTDVPTNRQQIAARLPNHLDCRVLYVESPSFLLSPFFGFGRETETAFHFTDSVRERTSLTIERVSDSLWVHTPLLPVPHRYAKQFPGFVFWLLRRQVARAAEILGFQSPIVWSHSPFGSAYLPRSIDPRGFVYDCVDRYDQLDYYTTYDLDVPTYQRETVDRADIMFVSSDGLYERFRQQHPNVHRIGNAADIDLFRRGRPGGEATLAAELEGVPKPIRGFYGLLSHYKLDFDLLRSLAEQLDASLVLLGPVDESLPGWVHEMENVYHLPRVPQHELPSYLAGFDVCLLPYKRTDYTQGVEPLKLYEYLAAERPIVSTNFSDLPEYGDWLRIAESDEEFIDMAADAVETPPTDPSPSITEHDWEGKIHRMLEALVASGFLEKPHLD